MNRTLFGLALLSYNWEHNKKDIIDCYIPLVCNVIKKKSYDKVNRDLLQADLLESYGIRITLGAIETILKRMVKGKLLTKEIGEYIVDLKKILLLTRDELKDELDIAFNSLVVDINKYSQEHFHIEFTQEDIEVGLIAFFKEYDLDLLFAAANPEDSALPSVKESKKVKYIIARYIMDLQEKQPSRFKMALKLARGYAIASLISYESFQFFSGNLSGVSVFLDAPIIFNLLGLNGESNLLLSKELVNTLKANGAHLKVFQINYGEVIKTVQDAIKRLNFKNYEISKSSRILRTAIRESISAQQLQIKLNQLDSLLQEYEIEKCTSPSLDKGDYKYQIDQGKLTEIIEELYKKDEFQKIPWYKANQIERDVESIANIFKLRKNTQSLSLKGCKAILLTGNEIIAFAAKKYERGYWEFKSTIPVCVTDIFLSTIIWANYPEKNENLNIKQLISECYDIVELDNRLLNKFYDDINRMHKENILTDDQFYLLSASNLTYTLLERKTLNDIEEYTDKTPSEILEDLQARVKSQVVVRDRKLQKIENNIRKVSNSLARSVFFLMAISLMSLMIWVKAKNPQFNHSYIEFFFWAIGAFLTVFGILRWMELIPTKYKIESKVEQFLFERLNRILNQD